MGESRRKLLNIRAFDTEKEEAIRLYESLGFNNLSEYTRECWKHAKSWTPEDIAHKKHIRRQVAQACNNINQIARAPHQNKSVDVLMELSVIRAVLEELL